MNRPPLLIVGDLHLGPVSPNGTEEAFVELLGRYADSELVCLGDLLDLSADTSGLSAPESVVAHLNEHAALSQALRQRLSAGAATTLVVGNHDAELGAMGVRAAVLRRFGLPECAPLTLAPWWIR